MASERISKRTQQIALTGLLAALALALSFLESLLPAIAFMPPGAKLGLANIVVMLALYFLGLPYALGIVLAKACFAGLVRGMSAMFISLVGGLFSLLVLFLLKRFLKGRVGILGISISSAAMHNLGQLLAASIIAGTSLFFAYAPLMLIAALAAGTVTGLVYWVISPHAGKYFQKDKN